MAIKAALVTGGAKRIGRRIALLLASMGYNIALHYNKSRREALETMREIKKQGRECMCYHCDFLNSKETSSLVKKVRADFPSLEVLVNNASVFKRAPLIKTDQKLLNEQVSVNFKAPFILSQEFARLVKKGHILNMLDSGIKGTQPNYSAYLTSKKALGYFTLLAARELAPGIRVNAVAPGFIMPQIGEEKSFRRILKKSPLKIKGEILYLEKAIKFLLDDKYITGQVIFVDGGAGI